MAVEDEKFSLSKVKNELNLATEKKVAEYFWRFCRHNACEWCVLGEPLISLNFCNMREEMTGRLLNWFPLK